MSSAEAIELDDELLLAVATLEAEIETGIFGDAPLTVNGEVLGVLLPMDWITDLLRRGARPPRASGQMPVPSLRHRASRWARQAELYT